MHLWHDEEDRNRDIKDKKELETQIQEGEELLEEGRIVKRSRKDQKDLKDRVQNLGKRRTEEKERKALILQSIQNRAVNASTPTQSCPKSSGNSVSRECSSIPIIRPVAAIPNGPLSSRLLIPSSVITTTQIKMKKSRYSKLK